MRPQHRRFSRRTAAVVIALALALVVPSGAAAQPAATGSPQAVEDLRRRLEEFERATRAQIEALRAQIAQQESELIRLRPASPASPAVPATPATPTTSDRAVVSATASQETFNRDRETAARVDNVPIDPAMIGFFGIPNTPARLKVDGYAKLDTIFDTRPAGNADLFNVGGIPINLPGPERVSNTNIHARQTRVQLDFRSPTGTSSEFRAFAEIDFFGSSGPVDPRMRHFYGQVKNVLLGQTWTTFTDVDAFPDQLDFAGPAGISFLRQPQIRYTHPLARGRVWRSASRRPRCRPDRSRVLEARIHRLQTSFFAIASRDPLDTCIWDRSTGCWDIALRLRIERTSAMPSTRVEA